MTAARTAPAIWPARPAPPSCKGSRCPPAGPAKCGRKSKASPPHSAKSPRYLLLTDADIVYAPGALQRIVARAERGRPGAHLGDGEAALRKLGGAGVHSGLRLLLPDAVPVRLGEPPGMRDRRGCRRLHAGARDALERAAASTRIRGALIDDCALAAQIKAQGPIWLGLTERVAQHPPLSDTSGHPPHGGALGLCAIALFAAAARRHASLGMALTYLAPPLLALFGSGPRAGSGSAAWR